MVWGAFVKIINSYNAAADTQIVEDGFLQLAALWGKKNKKFTKTGVKRLRIGFQQDLKCHIGNFSVVVNKKTLQETDFR